MSYDSYLPARLDKTYCKRPLDIAIAKSDPQDGDGDGMINDGKPNMRPSIIDDGWESSFLVSKASTVVVFDRTVADADWIKVVTRRREAREALRKALRDGDGDGKAAAYPGGPDEVPVLVRTKWLPKTGGWGIKLDDEGEAYVVQPRKGTYSPVMSLADAKAAGFTDGPYYHGTTRAHAKSIKRRGFHEERFASGERHSYGTIEEMQTGHQFMSWMTKDHDAAIAYADQGGGEVITVFTKPGMAEPQAGVFTGESAFVVRDVRDMVVVKGDATVAAEWTPEEMLGKAQDTWRSTYIGSDALTDEAYRLAHDLPPQRVERERNRPSFSEMARSLYDAVRSAPVADVVYRSERLNDDGQSFSGKSEVGAVWELPLSAVTPSKALASNTFGDTPWNKKSGVKTMLLTIKGAPYLEDTEDNEGIVSGHFVVTEVSEHGVTLQWQP